jgi:hypothetical protein
MTHVNPSSSPQSPHSLPRFQRAARPPSTPPAQRTLRTDAVRLHQFEKQTAGETKIIVLGPSDRDRTGQDGRRRKNTITDPRVLDSAISSSPRHASHHLRSSSHRMWEPAVFWTRNVQPCLIAFVQLASSGNIHTPKGLGSGWEGEMTTLFKPYATAAR